MNEKRNSGLVSGQWQRATTLFFRLCDLQLVIKTNTRREKGWKRSFYVIKKISFIRSILRDIYAVCCRWWICKVWRKDVYCSGEHVGIVRVEI